MIDIAVNELVKSFEIGNNLLDGVSFDVNAGERVGIMGRIDWSLNRRWLKFLSESGTPLFVSCKPDVADEQIKADLREAFRRASVARDEMIPLDWMECATPHTFLVGDDVNGERVTYDWYPEKGAETFRPGV